MAASASAHEDEGEDGVVAADGSLLPRQEVPAGETERTMLTPEERRAINVDTRR